MALTGLAIAAALSLAKSKMIDEPAANRQRKLAAETQRYSPWTHLQAQAPQDPNAIGQMLQYGATGAAIGSGMKKGTTGDDVASASKAYSNFGNTNNAQMALSNPYSRGGYAGSYDPNAANLMNG